jgi:NAD(P)-dependent dehydrogenase (short-subunit alcohol dehydrogenase family)
MSSPAVYSYTKSGIIGLTRYLATYWAHHNIRVNALTPGGVESSQTDNFKKRYNNRIPLNRMAKEEDLIGGLIFLASDASNYMTGQNIILDGGLSAW